MLDRRRFLWRSGGGLGGIALASLLGADGLLADTTDGTPYRFEVFHDDAHPSHLTLPVLG